MRPTLPHFCENRLCCCLRISSRQNRSPDNNVISPRRDGRTGCRDALLIPKRSTSRAHAGGYNQAALGFGQCADGGGLWPVGLWRRHVRSGPRPSGGSAHDRRDARNIAGMRVLSGDLLPKGRYSGEEPWNRLKRDGSL